ncbi:MULTISPECIES: hypothetical protein [unclassified Bradyrhizobium]|uniref:hypothetical protein n=1 Tax=unclassified Bradyrhizobium TaxID=2631580 RepID=UPI00291643BF|nr:MULTISPECIES: hypothetical protein [unclassified Bradyrhizobium]
MYTAEKALMRLAGASGRPSLPLTLTPAQLGTATPEMSALLSAGSYRIAARLAPSEFTHADVIEAERAFAQAEEEEEREDEQQDEDAEPVEPVEDDGGMGLVELVQSLMGGNETLEQLTLLLFRNCSDTWWTANEIQDYLQRIKGKDVPMSSVSPMLTALKNSGIIVREGHNIALAEKAYNVRQIGQR